MRANVDYLQAIREQSARFAQTLTSADPSASVPTCPEWNADDLLWHLTEVQDFWTTIVRDRLIEPEAAEAAAPPRPGDRHQMVALFHRGTGRLVDTLAATPDETTVWTWAPQQSVGFIRRHQAAEALIHRLDAELTGGVERAPISAALAADVVDEALNVSFGYRPAWAPFVADGRTVWVIGTDTGDRWSLALGHWSGTSPDTGKTYEQMPVLLQLQPPDGGAATAQASGTVAVDSHTVTGASPADVQIVGAAADLAAWIYVRPPAGDVTVSGDQAAIERFERIRSNASQ